MPDGVSGHGVGLEGPRRTHLSSSDRAARASALLRAWVEEGDPEEQRETGEYLLHALDEDRPSLRPHFPDELKGVTW